MATVSTLVQLPQAYNLIGKDGKLTQEWYFFFQQLLRSLPIPGSSGVTTTTPPMNIAWGPDLGKGSPTAGNVYFATDTGRVYIGDGSIYHIEFPAITGDATKPVGSSVLTLNTVNLSPGTYGDGANIPVITVNAKGLATNITVEPISFPPGAAPGGVNGSIQFNSGGSFGGDTSLTYNPVTLELALVNENVSGAISFINPVPTLNNLLPSQIGNNGKVLTTDGTNASWGATIISSSWVPFFNPPLTTFMVPPYQQALFTVPIDNEGILDIEGILVYVD